MPQRNPVLELLAGYKAFDGNEAALLERILEFVRREPACFERSTQEGHLTGSAWVLDPAAKKVLLLHHAKLGKWLQPGGHADGDPDLERVARREVFEETGLEGLELSGNGIFDVDAHWIPAWKDDPGHWHFDVRFCFLADSNAPLRVNAESHELAWVPLDRVGEYTQEESVRRMVRKSG
ncbi:MAG: NUDIX hydrolase [Methylacidiphilales bacterium]|nr:NUDIX hydrolase [Candidatus Methylacidiphilales bacterium]